MSFFDYSIHEADTGKHISDIEEFDIATYYYSSTEQRSIDEIKALLKAKISIFLKGTNFVIHPCQFDVWSSSPPPIPMQFDTDNLRFFDPPNMKPVCKHEKKYLNKISNSLQFMVCPTCGEEVK